MIEDLSIDTIEIKDNAITSAKIVNQAVTPAKLSQPLTQATAVATTSGTAIDFTGIPSWVRRITLAFQGVSLSSTGDLLLQLGTSSGVETTGYASQVNAFNNTPGGAAATNGVQITRLNAATYAWNGTLQIVNVSGNTWIVNGTALTDTAAVTSLFSGSKTLAGVLDRIRLTRTGTDTFDAGSVNIIYE